MHFLWYEDMKKDHLSVLRGLSTFLGKPQTESQLEALRDHLTIDSMRKVAVENSKNMSGGSQLDEDFSKGFFRKGTVGDWKNYFQGDKAKEWDEWIKAKAGELNVEMSFSI